MVRNKKTVLPKGHLRKYTSNGTTQVSQADRIAHSEELIAAGQRKAEKAAEERVAAAEAKAADARAEADAARASAAAVEHDWQVFNDTNLAEAIRQKDAAQWKAALQEKAYKEVYATASEGIFAAAHIASAAADGAKLLCKAGDEANKLLVSDYNADHNLLDLDAAFAFTDVRTQYKSIALTASNTTPIAHCFQQLRKIDKRARQHK